MIGQQSVKEAPRDYNKRVLQRFERIFADSQTQMIFYFSMKAQVTGRVLITNYRCIFYSQDRTFFDIPVGYISKSQRTLDQSNCSIVQIFLKYGPTFKLRFPEARFTNSITILNILTKLTSVGIAFALQYTSAINNPANQEDQKLREQYLQTMTCGQWLPKQHINQQNNLQKTPKQMDEYDNKQWKYFPNYPQKFIVPIPYIAKRQLSDRLIVLSYIYRSKTIVKQNMGKNGNDKEQNIKEIIKIQQIKLWRTGPGRTDPSQDQWVPRASMRENHQIIEVRSKGIGSNKNITLKRVIQLDNPTMLKQSINKVCLLAFFGSNQPQKYLHSIHNSRWFQQIIILFYESEFIRRKMKQNVSVTMLCENDARGAQFASLIQIAFEPKFRTFQGFQNLLQKQFLQYGSTKVGGTSKKDKQKQKDDQKGLMILQFLDCVFQLTVVYPLSFQFNEKYLIFLASNIFSNKYGNFLYSTKSLYDNSRGQVERCPSIWRYIDSNLQQFRNCYFVNSKDSDMHQLKQQTPMKNMQLWQGFFLNIINSSPGKQSYLKRHEELRIRHLDLKHKTQELRKKINQQHVSITEKKKILKQLKQIQLE